MKVLPFSNVLLEGPRETQAFVRRRTAGLGKLSVLGDDTILLQVLPFLGRKELQQLAKCSKIAFAFASFDSLWKELFVCDDFLPRDFSNYKGSFRNLVLGHERWDQIQGVVYSDELYKPQLFKFASIEDNVLRLLKQSCSLMKCVDEEKLSVSDFVSGYEEKNIPVLIRSNIRDEWPVFKRWPDLKRSSNAPNLGQANLKNEAELNEIVRAGELNLKFKDFINYCEHCEQDESQLYLFDCSLFHSVDHFKNLFQVPKYFASRDLLDTMGPRRPDHSWIIAGSAESCSKWHIDPNYTHAWNAVISGSKLWIMSRFQDIPEGVFPSEDLTDVMQPVTLAEWFHSYFEQTCDSLGRKLVYVIAKPGDVVFVPSRWWHCVVNLEPTTAITQNYIATSNLAQSLNMMKNQPELVSGISACRNKNELFGDFLNALKANLATLDERAQRVVKAFEVSGCVSKQSTWEQLKKQKVGGDFSFSFF